MSFRSPKSNLYTITTQSHSKTSRAAYSFSYWKRKEKKERKELIAMATRSQMLKGAIEDEELKKIIDANMDEAPARRRAREAFKDIQFRIDHCLFKIPSEGLKINEMYEVNSRGMKVFSKSWFPETSTPKALICIARKLSLAGYGVYALDYPGFGLSDGLHGFIPSFETLVDDVIEQFTKFRENPEVKSLPCFLFGQSMGGAVALKIHLKQPNSWNGAVLVAPMCKIADDMYPPWILTKFLIGVSKFLPESKLVPGKDLAEMAFREKKELTAYNVISYKGKPRLKTAVELLNTTDEIARRLEEVSLPLLILHGEADVVTDPSVSKALYEKASSKDKKLNLYEKAYHALLEGEPDEVKFRVFDDIISWLDEHSVPKLSALHS
ncbi:hypothetical protein V2J09_012608 [Rumex salicifolius]